VLLSAYSTTLLSEMDTPPRDPSGNIHLDEPEPLDVSPPSPFDGSLRPQTPPQDLLADRQSRIRPRDPVDVELLRQASAQGQLQDVHQILSQYLVTQAPDPATGELKLTVFCDSIPEAIAHNHPKILSYLFFMHVGEPSLYVNEAIKARSSAIFEVFLRFGWNINKPVERTMAPALGYAFTRMIPYC
jgi:hypothetical protein